MARADANKTKFTEMTVRRLRPSKSGKDDLLWDSEEDGLHVLVGAGGTLTYRSYFRLKGKPVARKLGRVKQSDAERAGEIDLKTARLMCREDRVWAEKGIDPRKPKPANPTEANRYDNVLARFMTEYAKPQMRRWDDVERVLRGPKKDPHPWLMSQFKDISKDEVKARLRQFLDDGTPYKAKVLKAWMRKLFKWAAEEDIPTPQFSMDTVSVKFEGRVRDRVYTDAEIAATWRAAEQFDATESAYVKLLMLLAPRKTALAAMTGSELDSIDNPTLWTVPFSLTKSKKSTTKKRQYLVPLPPLCRRLIKGIASQGRLFPSLSIVETKAGSRDFDGTRFRKKLIAHGAPADFQFHAWRHTVSTWLENEGYGEWERGLVLNHSGSGSVTAGYSHGYPRALKLKLLSEWSDHVESLIVSEGVALLR